MHSYTNLRHQLVDIIVNAKLLAISVTLSSLIGQKLKYFMLVSFIRHGFYMQISNKMKFDIKMSSFRLINFADIR